MRITLKAKARLLRAALQYAEHGWPVLPLVPQAKTPLTPKGLLNASTDPKKIELWWQRWPEANIGLRTGDAFDVLDIDGDVGRASLEAKAGPEWEHSGPVSRTGRGEHWLYQPSGTANRANMLPKLDWRGDRGYIVAPPSVHPDGHLYLWTHEHGPQTPLPPVPDWLTDLLVPTRTPTPETPLVVLTTNQFDQRAKIKAVLMDPYRYQALQTDIVALCRELGYDPQPKGGQWAIQCIFHPNDNEASMVLYPRDNSFYCFGCNAWGDAMNIRDKRPGGHRA